MVIAETKRQMHETLEMKEEEISQLRAQILQVTLQRDELQEQKEKAEKSAFEELEKALSAAQKSEEQRKKIEKHMRDQIIAIEKVSEEDRKNLQQELSRVKQEAVNIVKKSSDEHVAELEKLHADALACKGRELEQRLQTQEQEFKEQLKTALEKCHSEYLGIIQEKEQQGLLALEELELQKNAVQLQNDEKIQELHQEVESQRTKILDYFSVFY
ncbi:golgin subfamily A member 4-like [Protopterus annectens]|uniref:golgin subfamily A member 4-like n=1 Tax=Protopterus annectens TaxID=7888 RepID=UPI001CF984B8|nr:golgin subfamily A member 4-like [Protopterus annectens]